MTSPWWGRERSPWAEALTGAQTANGVKAPVLHKSGSGTLAREVLDSAPSFTPEWTNLRDEDAGFALVQLFDSMGDPVLRRLNRVPEKYFNEFLSGAGVVPRPARPAEAMLAFTASKGAPAAVTVAAGFQVSADSVFFETTDTAYVIPGKIEATYFTSGQLVQELNIADENGWLPLGTRPQAGSSMLIGLTGDAAVGASVSLGIALVGTDGPPPPGSSGGLLATAALPQPLLIWDYFDGGSFQPFEVIRDETRGLQQTGIVELAAPERWRAGTPPGVNNTTPLRWLRLRLVHGEFENVPRLSVLSINVANALAVRTIRDEVPPFVPGSQRRRMILAQRPVLANSLELVVSSGGPEPQETVWQPIQDLATAGPNATVYQFNAATGEILFGDGVNGALVPPGFRNVVARRYQVGGGAAGAVAKEKITRLRQSAPFLTAVTNPLAASGGTDEQALDDVLRTGPERIRSRNRAVTTADYALLALDAVGANIQRAHGVAAMHPLYPGAVIPGVVTVFVVPAEGEIQPPTPTSDTLVHVATYLTQSAAPAGVQVVAAAPRFHNVSVRARLVTRKNADASAAVRNALLATNEYLHPLRGGDDRQGWPFGGTLRYQSFVRRLLADVPGLVAVSSLNFEVDGVLMGVCADFVPEPNSLLWGGTHAFTTEQED
jgi:hypothetical protein